MNINLKDHIIKKDSPNEYTCIAIGKNYIYIKHKISLDVEKITEEEYLKNYINKTAPIESDDDDDDEIEEDVIEQQEQLNTNNLSIEEFNSQFKYYINKIDNGTIVENKATLIEFMDFAYKNKNMLNIHNIFEICNITGIPISVAVHPEYGIVYDISSNFEEDVTEESEIILCCTGMHYSAHTINEVSEFIFEELMREGLI